MAPTVHTPPINTYVPLESIVLTNAASSVTFFNIPQSDANGTYKDLVLVFNGLKTGTANGYAFQMQYNGDTGTNYSWVRMWGEGTGGSSNSSTTTYISCGDFPSGTYNARIMMRAQIMDYSATDKHKSALIREDFDPGVNNYNAMAIASRWASNTAISSITFTISGAQSFDAGSTFTLYAVHG